MHIVGFGEPTIFGSSFVALARMRKQTVGVRGRSVDRSRIIVFDRARAPLPSSPRTGKTRGPSDLRWQVQHFAQRREESLGGQTLLVGRG